MARDVTIEEEVRERVSYKSPYERWKGRKMVLDTEAHSWFMGILGIIREKKALDYARRLAAQGLVRRRAHTLMSQLLIVGEYSIQV